MTLPPQATNSRQTASTSADNVSPRDVRIRLLDADGGNAVARFQFVTFMARSIDWDELLAQQFAALRAPAHDACK